MKLKNKISGEVKEFTLFDGNELQGGVTLESLTKEWEDYEGPKGYWMINSLGEIICPYDAGLVPKGSKEIGNYFSSREEAELAVRKLKAWKRLKDKGLKFTYWKKSCNANGKIVFHLDELGPQLANFKKDLDLLFCTEEDG